MELRSDKAVDSTVDLGVKPTGLTRAHGCCNYQWAVEGPLGAVVFYCTNAELLCIGNPHRVEIKSVKDRVLLEWINEDDKSRRLADRLADRAKKVANGAL